MADPCWVPVSRRQSNAYSAEIDTGSALLIPQPLAAIGLKMPDLRPYDGACGEWVKCSGVWLWF
jgi:hypothetical protein